MLETSFAEMGFDSLAAASLASALSRVAGMKIAPTIVYDYPSIGKVAEYVVRRRQEAGLLGRQESLVSKRAAKS